MYRNKNVIIAGGGNSAVEAAIDLAKIAKHVIFELSVDGIFVEIGNIPNNELFKDFLELNAMGEVIVDSRKRTNIPGIYAAGDVTDVKYKQIIIATCDGAVAALAANDYINLQKAKERINEYEVF